jgi:hypothetical protein
MQRIVSSMFMRVNAKCDHQSAALGGRALGCLPRHAGQPRRRRSGQCGAHDSERTAGLLVAVGSASSRVQVGGVDAYQRAQRDVVGLFVFDLYPRVRRSGWRRGTPSPTPEVGTSYPSLEPVNSSTPRSAPLSRCTLLRHSFLVRTVCVDALVRICAGGDQGWSSLPRQ